MSKPVYTDSEFWKLNPCPEDSSGNFYSIGTTPYRKCSDGKWYKVKQGRND